MPPPGFEPGSPDVSKALEKLPRVRYPVGSPADPFGVRENDRIAQASWDGAYTGCPKSLLDDRGLLRIIGCRNKYKA